MLTKIAPLFTSLILMIPLTAQIKVACIGDSITYGAAIKDRANNCYPQQLASLLGEQYSVKNFGVNGATMLSKGNRPYLKRPQFKAALKFNPDIVIISLGTNDSKPLNWKYGSEYKNDYLHFIKAFQDLPSAPKVFVCLSPPIFKNSFQINAENLEKQIHPIQKEVASEQNLTLVDLYSPLLTLQSLFPDGVHPNAKGASIIAKAIAKPITQNSPAK